MKIGNKKKKRNLLNFRKINKLPLKNRKKSKFTDLNRKKNNIKKQQDLKCKKLEIINYNILILLFFKVFLGYLIYHLNMLNLSYYHY